MKNLDSSFSKATQAPNMVGKLDHFLILSDKSLCKKPLGNTQSFVKTVTSTTGMTGAVSTRHRLSVLGVHSPPCWDAAELSLFTTINFKLKPFSESSSSGSLAPMTWRNACVLFSFLQGDMNSEPQRLSA